MATPRKKVTEVPFPPASCGACTFCVTSNGDYYCCTMKPLLSEQDAEGYDLCDSFLTVEMDDPVCIHFNQRCDV